MSVSGLACERVETHTLTSHDQGHHVHQPRRGIISPQRLRSLGQHLEASLHLRFRVRSGPSRLVKRFCLRRDGVTRPYTNQRVKLTLPRRTPTNCRRGGRELAPRAAHPARLARRRRAAGARAAPRPGRRAGRAARAAPGGGRRRRRRGVRARSGLQYNTKGGL